MIEQFIEKLQRLTGFENRKAIKDFAKRGTLAMEKLTAYLQNSHFESYQHNLRKDLLLALAAFGEPAIEPLISLITNNKQVEQTPLIADALATIESVNGKKLSKLLMSEIPQHRQFAIYVIGHRENKDSISILQSALRCDSDIHVREIAASRLAAMNGKDALEGLFEAINDGPEIKKHVALGLGKLREKYAFVPLTQMLADPTTSRIMTMVRSNAAFALGELRDARAVQVLLNFLDQQKVEPFKSSGPDVLVALGKLGDVSATKPIIAILRDRNSDQEQRVAACIALGLLRDQKAVPALNKALKDADIRKPAAAALGEIASQSAIEPLLDALKKESYKINCGNIDNEFRKEIVSALGKIRCTEAFGPLFELIEKESGHSPVGKAAVEAIKKTGEPLVPFLIAKAKEGNDNQKPIIVSVLKHIGTPAIMPLLDTLKQGTQDISVEDIQLLGEIGHSAAARPLLHIMSRADENKSLVEEAKKALARIVDETIKPLYADESDFNRELAQEITEDILKRHLPVFKNSADQYGVATVYIVDKS